MQDDRPRRGKGRRGSDGRPGPGMDSGFFTSHGFDNEFDANAFENTALNNMDPIREAQLFEEFEQDFRSGGYDPGPELDRPGPDPRDRTGYRPADSGHRATDSGYREAPERGERNGKPRHGKPREKHQPPEAGAAAPMFDRRDRPPTQRPPMQRPAVRRSGSASANQSPFGELTGYVVPILVAVVVVMVLVVLLLNR